MKRIEELTNNILYLPANSEVDRPILACIIGEKAALIIDSGNSPQHADAFLTLLSKYKIPKRKYIAITHWHWDHIFGIKEMNLPTIAHFKTKLQMEKLVGLEWTDQALEERVRAGTEISFCAEMIKKEFRDRSVINITFPDILFEKRLAIDLGGVNCIIENVGGDHSEDSTVIFVEEKRVLFLGDSLGPDLYSGEWRYSHNKLLALLDKIESYNAQIYVESHGKPLAKEEFKEIINGLRTIAIATSKFRGNRSEIIKESKKHLHRDLDEDEEETIDYLINGLGKEQ